MLVQCHLPTGTDISTSSDPATKNMVTTDLCFTQLMIGHLRLDYSCLHVKALKYYLPQEAPDELFASVYHSIWRSPTFLSTYVLPFKFFLCWCTVWQKCIPRNGEILKKPWEWHHPISICVSEHVWTMWMLVSDIWMWSLLKGRFNTKVKIIHLCWNKQLM